MDVRSVKLLLASLPEPGESLGGGGIRGGSFQSQNGISFGILAAIIVGMVGDCLLVWAIIYCCFCNSHRRWRRSMTALTLLLALLPEPGESLGGGGGGGGSLQPQNGISFGIVAAIIAGVVGVCLLVWAIIYCCCCKSHRRQSSTMTTTPCYLCFSPRVPLNEWDSHRRQCKRDQWEEWETFQTVPNVRCPRCAGHMRVFPRCVPRRVSMCLLWGWQNSLF